ncbi:MAG: DPP IV N-terminal domain-containing protein [Acidobacteriota bacterium]
MTDAVQPAHQDVRCPSRAPSRRFRGAWLPYSMLMLLLLCVGVAPSAMASESGVSFDVVLDAERQAEVASNALWSPDGQRLVYLWDDGEGDALWIWEAESGESRLLLAAGESQLGSIQDMVWAEDNNRMILKINGDLVLFQVKLKKLRTLTNTRQEESDAKFSPDGGHVSYVRDGNLYLYDLRRARERALTTDGDPPKLLNGITDWVYWEELWGRSSTGYWWSPDGSRIAFYHFDESGVGEYPLVDYSKPYPIVEWQKYPTAGSTNPEVNIGILTLGSEATEGPDGATPATEDKVLWLKNVDSEGWYLPRVHWSQSGELAVERLNHEQDVLELKLCSPTNGICRPLIDESSETWVNVTKDTRFLRDGSVIWSSDASGTRQIYLHGANGQQVRQLSDGEAAVDKLVAVNEREGWILYSRYGDDFLGAKDRQVHLAYFDGSKGRRLSPAEGWNQGEASGGSEFWLHSSNEVNGRERLTVRNLDGDAVGELPSRAASFDGEGLPEWEFLTIPGPDGVKLPAMRLLPPNLDRSTKVPAIMYHYGGPQSQVVSNRSDTRRRGLWHRYMASQGYVVLVVDNEASNYFGKTGADRLHRRFGPVNLAAQKAGVDYLASLSFVDADRVGLWGWSGGGSNTLYCLFNSPGTWAAGVSGAPVTNWRFYDTIWTERYLDHPKDNPEGYRLSSPVTHAANLEDALFLVHGTADDNVHPNNTFALSKALIDAGKDFDDAIYPDQKHGFSAAEMTHFLRRMTAFFDHHLKP